MQIRTFKKILTDSPPRCVHNTFQVCIKMCIKEYFPSKHYVMCKFVKIISCSMSLWIYYFISVPGNFTTAFSCLKKKITLSKCAEISHVMQLVALILKFE
ncbi:hypothetical protein KIL84_001111 [Mauremys mutica]|uniref:Uncharacterized protein n=1 Tax=Mauremys mutica TaxID=74926 RepID=A0A9D3WZN9_9SAUR|nr:hypothetical protein KIL84_001111 [Mauremys mutica]